MAGDPDGPGSGGHEDELAAERAASLRWRELAERRKVELATLQSRPFTRVALSLDRRFGSRLARADQLARGAVGRVEGLTLEAEAYAHRVAERRVPRIGPVALRDPAPLASPSEVTVIAIGRVVRGGILDSVPEGCEVVRVEGTTEPLGAGLGRVLEAIGSRFVVVADASAVPTSSEWLMGLLAPLSPSTPPLPGSGEPPATGASPDRFSPLDVLVGARALFPVERSDGRRTRLDGLDASVGVTVSVDEGAPVIEASGVGGRTEIYGPVEADLASTVAVAGPTALLAGSEIPPVDTPSAALLALGIECRRRFPEVGQIVAADLGLAVESDRARWSDRRGRVLEASPDERLMLAHFAPALRRMSLGDARFKVAITTPVPNRKVASEWGDWHHAEHLVRALGRAGHEAVAVTFDQRHAPAALACDVELVIRGLEAVEPTPGRPQILWMISNPESIDDHELDRAQLILCASPRFARHLATRTNTPVDIWLQGTDHLRFTPAGAGGESSSHRHPVTVVAQARHELRPAVAAAMEVGVAPAIHGQGWEGLVPDELICATYVPNEELAAVYRDAVVVLNDHTSTMAAWGFVSNRILDVLASGTPVVSEHLPEIPELFGDLVPTFSTPVELAEQVDRLVDAPTLAREMGARGRGFVLDGHTFDHRVAELIAHLDRHDIGVGPTP